MTTPLVSVILRAIARFDDVKTWVLSFLGLNQASSTPETYVYSAGASIGSAKISPHIKDNITFIKICEQNSESHYNIHVYQLLQDDDDDQMDLEHAKSEENVLKTISLPSNAYEDLWESLVYDTNIPQKLLSYFQTAIKFAALDINPLLINWNKLILLHGPPGSGKTSLCKAVAQKLSIRLADTYPFAKLVEISAHSLLSRFFGESAKRVTQSFARIHAMLDDAEVFVVVLIDEVESLSSKRKDDDTADATRVVNALLTCIDGLKSRNNCVVLTTSNMKNSIDSAFIDRADLMQFIGLPGKSAITCILKSCLIELFRSKMIVGDLGCSAGLMKCVNAALSKGLSGRALRKIPFLTAVEVQGKQMAASEFCQAMECVIRDYHDCV